MVIKVSKVFARFMNKSAAAAGVEFSASVVSLDPNYAGFVGVDPWEAYDHGDYDYNTGKIRAIMVNYPPEFYACARYVGTAELVKEFKRRGVRDAAGLSAMVVDMFSI